MLKNKRLFVKHYATIPPVYGGATVFVKRLSLALCKNGYLSGAFYSKNIEGIPAKYHYLYNKMIRHARSYLVLPRIFYLLKVFKPYQIIHTHQSFSTCFGIWLVHKLMKKPLVYTVHNEMIDRELMHLNLLDVYCLKSLFRDKSVQVTTVNHNAAKILRERFLFANNIKIVPAYIAPVEIGDIATYIPKGLLDFIHSHNKYIVFYAESFTNYNGKDVYGTNECVNIFINIHKIMPEIGLIFCMPNVNNYTKLNTLKDLIKRAGCLDHVYWQTSPLSEMWPILKKASLYLRLTTTDGDSILLREALGMGIPSLASDIVPRPQGCITYESNNPDDLLSKITELIENRPNINRNRHDFYESFFSIYESLLKQRL